MARHSSFKFLDASPKGSLTKKLLSENTMRELSLGRVSSPEPGDFPERRLFEAETTHSIDAWREQGTSSPPGESLVRTCAVTSTASNRPEEPLFISSPRTPPTTGRRSHNRFTSSAQTDFHTHIGKRLCRDYTLIENIGQGDFGTVWKAYHFLERRFYAVKQSSRKFRGETDRQRSLQEVYALSACSGTCPYIVRYYESWTEGNTLFIKMEYCEGGSVRSALPLGVHQCSEPELWELIYQIGMALHNLHVRNIVHLDVKMDNIYIKHDGSKRVFKLGDFGLVRFVSPPESQSPRTPIGEEHTWRGTNDDEGDKRYLCPTFLSTNRYWKEADIYAFGLSLVELATGIVNSPSRTPREITRPGEDGMPHLSPEICTLIRSMCAFRPRDRPTAYELVLRAAINLEGLTESEVLEAKEMLAQREGVKNTETVEGRNHCK
ncbi:protein kinase [Perkinsela sp. CCAP 1560/4]|nr:protein kinase [Perkinsela sp. CCAP 1560/4]|eukprot:KNH01723.1 protein kinase [Perkinsela sp. CCAP 1560/4]